MKWHNIGHEFDAEWEKFRDQGIYLFGAGQLGREYFNNQFLTSSIKGFIDNDTTIKTYCGLDVISLDQYFRQGLNVENCLVICVSKKNMQDVVSQLEAEGLSEGDDFVRHDVYFKTILPLRLMHEKQLLHAELAQISLTERCTLRCKKCAHACHLVPFNAIDLSFDDVCLSAERFFSFVDYIQEFVLIGGEPLLYKELPQAIQYIGDQYRDKIGTFSITTNGTLLPNDETLLMAKEYDVTFRISNYSSAIPSLEKQYEKMANRLERAGVSCILYPKEGRWMDYGFDYVDRKASQTELEKVFNACMTPCHEMRRNRFYFCVMARTVAENMKKGVGGSDYLDLSQLSPDSWEDRMKFFEFMRGYSDKGYLDMCNFCHGADAMNYPIPAAEQMER